MACRPSKTSSPPPTARRWRTGSARARSSSVARTRPRSACAGTPTTTRVALTIDPAKQGVHADVAAAVRTAGNALANAGYAVEEVEPPDVAGVAATWTTICINEMRHVSQPWIRKYGGAGINRSLDLTLAAVADVDLDGYMTALALRARHVRDWMLFM